MNPEGAQAQGTFGGLAKCCEGRKQVGGRGRTSPAELVAVLQEAGAEIVFAETFEIRSHLIGLCGCASEIAGSGRAPVP